MGVLLWPRSVKLAQSDSLLQNLKDLGGGTLRVGSGSGFGVRQQAFP